MRTGNMRLPAAAPSPLWVPKMCALAPKAGFGGRCFRNHHLSNDKPIDFVDIVRKKYAEQICDFVGSYEVEFSPVHIHISVVYRNFVVCIPTELCAPTF